MKYILALAFVALLSSAAHAEPIPAYALDKDFDNCMGGQKAQQDPQRAQYCNCVRDAMRGWTLDEYGAVAMEQQKASSSSQTPGKIMEIANACINKILK